MFESFSLETAKLGAGQLNLDRLFLVSLVNCGSYYCTGLGFCPATVYMLQLVLTGYSYNSYSALLNIHACVNDSGICTYIRH